ncbi:hypothetical protein [Paludisphaera rhizosphaerae]|uniref:hypothetical protein n=1 Tax=Paludisphaera rhizosphaerae TaxID=2711216 RepID=UPI0013EADEC2|nr:hypothetical protein [Paludisphaera rhizosphaerae]
MRLIDLRCDWALQYAAETVHFDPNDYAEIPPRVPRLDGYFMGTSLAVLVCRRKPADWTRQADRWHALGEMIARHEAEFSGRLLRGPEDVARWLAEPADALSWGVLAVDGMENLIREPADLDRIPALFERGVRIFDAIPGNLGRGLLDRLLELSPTGEGPCPAVNLVGAEAAAVLDWFESDPTRSERLPLLFTGDLDTLGPAGVRRLRALGATIGVRPSLSAEAFREAVAFLAAIPFRGREGHEGIAVATDYLDLDEIPSELADVDRLTGWIEANLPPEVAPLVVAENARQALLALAGGLPK